MIRPGEVVAFIGVDGSGKTTQAERVDEQLEASGANTVYVRPVYELAGQLSLSTTVSPREERTMSGSSSTQILLWLLGYPYVVLSYVYLKYKYNNKVVVCDRFFYQFLYDIYGKYTWYLLPICPTPDQTIFLDVGLETVDKRLRGIDATVDEAYYADVIEFYRHVADRIPCHRADGTQPKDQLSEEVGSLIS